MGLYERLSKLVEVNLDELIAAAEDPERILDQAVVDMQAELVNLRQVVLRARGNAKRVEQALEQKQARIETLKQDAQMAVDAGAENLARELLGERNGVAGEVKDLQAQLERQRLEVVNLNAGLGELEKKIAEAKSRKESLKERLREARKLEAINRFDFEQMEKRIWEKSEYSTGSLSNADFLFRLQKLEQRLEAINSQFLRLVQENSTVLQEVRALVQVFSDQASGDAQFEQLCLNTAVDDELEQLRRQIDEL